MISRLLRNTLAGIATIALMASASLSQAQQVFKITAIPDESPAEVARKAEPLVKFLEKTWV